MPEFWYLQIDNFSEIGFLNPSNCPSVIFHLKKKLKKSEYWRTNEHFVFDQK